MIAIARCGYELYLLELGLELGDVELLSAGALPAPPLSLGFVEKYEGGRSKQAPLPAGLGGDSAGGSGIASELERSGLVKPAGARSDGALPADI